MNLLEIQHLKPHLRPPKSEALGIGTRNNTSGFHASSSLRTTKRDSTEDSEKGNCGLKWN